MAKILTVDQLNFVLIALVWPTLPNKMFGLALCNGVIAKCYVGYTLFYTSMQNRIAHWFLKTYNYITYGLWYGEEIVPKQRKSFQIGPTPKENWYKDSKLIAYETQPYMLSQYLTMMKMLGYVSLFGAQWFWAPFVLYITSRIFIRIHATNVLTNYRRPLPDR